MTYQTDNPGFNEPRVIKARKHLQAKIGTGKVDPRLIESMQEYLDNLKVDYEPIAKDYMDRIDELLAEMPENNYDREYYLNEIMKPVMDMKATGGMFNEHVVSNVSGTVLRLLENMHSLDDDMVAIVQAHNTIIRSAIALGVRSMEDQRAQRLVMEIKKACKRYVDKMSAKKQ
jgi:hypothetical protein